jgi:hypothetical protein
MNPVNASVELKERRAEATPGLQVVASTRRGVKGRWFLLAAATVLVCVVAGRDIRLGEFEYNVDEAQHAVTGLFVADALHDLPLRHPVQYAYRYYAQYPAVAVLHWPPLFHLFEAVSFLLLGASVVSARLTVMLFLVVLLYQWFRLVEEMQDSYTAGIATAVLGLLPMVVVFEKTIMLEIPSLALCVAAIRHWIAYLDRGQKGSLYAFGLWLSAALLCKQNSAYVLVFCGLTLLVTGRWERVLNRSAIVVAGLGAVLVAPLYTLMLLVQGSAMANDLGSHQMGAWERVSYYIRTLPASFSPALLALAVLGVLLSRRWNRRGQTAIMLCWILSGYLTFTLFGQKETRFAIYWFPPLVYFGVGLLTQFFRESRLRLAMRAAAVGLVVMLALPAWSQQRPYIAGYRDVAARLVNTYHAGIVLFDGRVPGNFVFYMRALDPNRHFLVLRKSLYANNVRPGARSEEFLHSHEDVSDLFRRDGIRFAVVSENAPLHFDSQRLLREQLQSDQFQLLGRFPIVSNQRDWQGENLLLYENKQWTLPADKVLRIRMLTLPHDIVVPIEQLGFGQ